MDNLQAVIDAARAGQTPVRLLDVGKIAHFSVPSKDGPVLKAISLESGLAAPVRKRGTIEVFDAASFNAILDANTDAGNIVVYVDRDADNPAIIAVMNGHGASGAGWGDFRVSIFFRFTPQWKKWKAIDGKMLIQAEFAEFIEDNLGDVASPPGAEMLEIAQYLSATRSVDFKSGVRLSDGRIQLTNVESTDAKVGTGQTAIPETIALGLAPVFGLPPFRVDARFRYRIEGGKLRLGIKLQRIEDIMAAVVNDMVHGAVGSEGRPAVVGIELPNGSVIVEGIAPAVTV